MAASADIVCALAALILQDAGSDITAEKISAILKAADIKIESYWPKLFAQAVQGLDIQSLMTVTGAVSSGPAAPAAPVESQQAAADAVDAKKKDESSESEDADMGFSLFD